MLQKTPSVPDDKPTDKSAAAAASAKEACLTYVSDQEPGIQRRKSGKGFRYIDSNKRPISNVGTLARIQSLVIPPAWTDVWICGDPDGHLQATGRDLRGRKQYRYHPRWSQTRDEVKYSSLAAFALALPALRERIDHDLRKRGLTRERVLASVVWLIDHTMIRVGNAVYARDNKSFGLTTLRSRHVKVEGDRLRFAFKGKSGKEWNLKLVDRRMAKIVRSIQEIPGQHLFQYIDDNGERRVVRSQDVNDYIRDASGKDFSSKHFRTWGGTTRALTLFAAAPQPETKRGTAKLMNKIIDQVSTRLGNTRTVCRKCYIHPKVFESWSAGRLENELARVNKTRRKPVEGLDDEENVVLLWLSILGT